jgi:hypothetical protein
VRPKYETKIKSKKQEKNDIEWSNPCGDQTTHFVNCTKNFNAENYYSNCKKTRTTSNGRPTICVSSANKRKTKVGWAVAIGQR